MHSQKIRNTELTGNEIREKGSLKWVSECVGILIADCLDKKGCNELKVLSMFHTFMR